MEDKIYKITLGDGTEISNLKLNGNNFISTEKIEESAFADNCSPVTISDGMVVCFVLKSLKPKPEYEQYH